MSIKWATKSIWQACTLNCTGFQSSLIVNFVGTELPQKMTQVQYLVHFCQIKIGKSAIEYDRIEPTQNNGEYEKLKTTEL